MKRITYKVEINGFEMVYAVEGINENKCYDILEGELRKRIKIETVSIEKIPVSSAKKLFNKLYSIL